MPRWTDEFGHVAGAKSFQGCPDPTRSVAGSGCRGVPAHVGVSAWSLADALRMIESVYGDELPAIRTIVVDVDLTTLALNVWEVGVPVWPGIWHPPLNLWAGPRIWGVCGGQLRSVPAGRMTAAIHGPSRQRPDRTT